ncbi:hypothetical protein IP69_16940 [Bosea sp. AAP35]|uniref:hypothetical protein n=1 Tax=Bosea sp. AAP35 TaxID=1523417 RepID=UPI0006B95F5E|nr:hypothetical protein [Bosea sp. AAP35]KPF65876.1 hypothetical protein IP69_16940 [Bosea sp. AAP35]
MADVIPLALHRRAQLSDAPAESAPAPATILFFTGVRYERQAEPVAAEPTVRRRSRSMTSTPAGAAKRPRKATSARQPA